MDIIQLAVQDLEENFSPQDHRNLLLYFDADTLEDLAEKIMKKYAKFAEMPAVTFEENTNEILSNLDSIKEKITKAGCKALKQLGFKFFGKAGTTGAKLYSATIDGIKVLVKETTENVYEDKVMGVVYETLVYRHFFNYLLTNRITPNIPYYYGMNICETRYPLIKHIELFNEHMQGANLYNYLVKKEQDKETVSTEFWKTVLFQILYTLICFQQFNIHHNDLHVGNIFLIPNMKGILRYYVNNTDYFTIDLDNAGLVKLFDMDTAGVDCSAPRKKGTEELYTNFRKDLQSILTHEASHFTKECPNLKIEDELYEEIGFKSKGENYFDLFITLCTIIGLHKNLLDDQTKGFIYRVFNKQDIIDSMDEESINYTGFFCRSEKISDETRGLAPLLNDAYFSSLKNVDTPTPASNIFHLIEDVPPLRVRSLKKKKKIKPKMI